MGKKKQEIIECPAGGTYLSDILYALQEEGHAPKLKTWQDQKQEVLKIIDRIWTEAKTEGKP